MSLSPKQVVEMRRRYDDGARQRDLSRAFGVSRRTVSNVVRGLTHRSAGGPISDRRCLQGSTLREKLEARRDQRGNDQCWPWRGAATPAGYGLIRHEREAYYAHRVAWELDRQRSIPDGMVIRHLCHNPSCCNPAHLAVGTYQDNSDDCGKAGRRPCGDSHWWSKLTEDDVRSILNELHNGETQVDIADRYGVSSAAIGKIARGNNWAHVPRPWAAIS